MRKKQLFALLMAGALSVGMAPTATFAADTAAETSAEGELEGELDSADTEEPSENPAETPEEPAEDPAETPEDPAETPAETTADPTEAPTAEETDEQAAEAGSAIVIGGDSFTSLEKAFAAVPDCEDMINGEPTYVKLKGTIEVNNTINVPEKKNIMLVAAEDNTTIKRAAGFTESMFTVNGGNLQMAGGSVTDSDGNAIGSGSLTVEGTGDGVTGSIVDVVSGNYALIDGTTLKGNTTTGNGGAVNNAAGANVYLLGGTITANSAAAGGAIYSEGTVNIRGTVSVTGNTVTNSFEVASNLVLAKDGVINVSGAVTGSAIGVAVQEANAGRTVVKLGDAVTDVKLADVLSQITYEGDSSLKIGEDGTLVSTTEPSPTPTPAEEKLKVTGKECKWSGSGTVKIKFQSNVKGTYYIDWVKRGEKAPTIDTSRVGAPIEADTNVTAKVTDLLDKAGLAYELYSNIKPNPTIENVQQGVKALHDAGADYMIAIGGGSSMDTAKAVGIIDKNPEFADVRSLEGVAPTKNPCTPIFAVSTTAGTAAEVTINYVITDVEKDRKMVCVDVHDIPVVAFVDPDMMSSMPKGLTAATGMDALTHAIEGYITKGAWEMSDMFHIKAIEIISKSLRGAVENTPEGREGMALGQYVAGMGFSNVGLGLVHSMAHPLGALYDTPHGVANAIILPTVMEYNAPYTGEKYKDIAEAMGVDTTGMSQEEYRKAAVDAVKQLSKDVGIPADLKEIVKEEDLQFLSESALADACCPGNPRNTSVEEIKELYKSLL